MTANPTPVTIIPARQWDQLQSIVRAAWAIPIKTYKGYDDVDRCAQCTPTTTDCPHIRLRDLLRGLDEPPV